MNMNKQYVLSASEIRSEMSEPRIARKIPYKVEPTMWCSLGSNVHPTGRCTKFERHHTAKKHSEKTCENCLKGSLVISPQEDRCIDTA